jgi:hypothetical protein
MARATEWRRFTGEYVNSAASLNHHEVLMTTLSPGETLARIRFQWQAQHSSEFAMHGTGFLIAAGIINLPLTGSFPVPDPYEFPDDPWIWWNAPIMQTAVSYTDPTGNINNLDVAPLPSQEIDVRAQRMASPAGDGVYFSTGTSTLSTSQSTHYLSVSASCLVLLAP